MNFQRVAQMLTYLRSTMTQKQVTHVALLHIHKELTALLDFKKIAREFVSRNNHRQTSFGKTLVPILYNYYTIFCSQFFAETTGT